MNRAKNVPGILPYTLEAKTPLIHFQYGQDGATLRATEVKPKLDKFLISKKGDVPENWFIGKTQALNYKIRLRRIGTPKDKGLEIKNFKAYFANMGGNYKDFVFYNISMHIICAIPELCNFIDQHIKAFFILTNFGARQSKGFGGFLIEDTTADEIDNVIKNAGTVNFGFKPAKNETTTSVFSKAHYVYSVLKGGINIGKTVPGFSITQFLPPEIGSEKDLMRSLVGLAPNSCDSFLFIRALLGLADHYDYRSKKWSSTRTITVLNFDNTEINENGECIVDTDAIKRDAGIKRFRSPITVNFFDHRIVFMLDDSYNLLLDKTFILLHNQQLAEFKGYKTEAKTNSSAFEKMADLLKKAQYINTPKSFDAVGFVKDFVAYFNKKADRAKNITLTSDVKEENNG